MILSLPSPHGYQTKITTELTTDPSRSRQPLPRPL